ncbi:MAG TPA: iron-sulfur cluster repair di-iron protein [Planctomycetes bacterium]|nr:iron-sulfur cluster repair di-iron protein [Planctomycetota bacterium]
MKTTDATLGELVTANPAAIGVFHRFGLDFCCGGRQSLAQACTKSDVDPEIVLREIGAAAGGAHEDVRWDRRPIEELVRYILDRYHAPLRKEIPRLIELSRRVERVHAGKPECPEGLADLLADVCEAVESHLVKEEKILFPLILSGRGPMARMPVQVMVQEHEDHGRNLRRIRTLTNDFRVPEHACASWRELYRALAALEVELMAHIHLENNILFPRALVG